MECHYSVWGVLAFLSLALVVSLILNISHYMQKKQAKVYKDYEDNCPSYDDYYTEDDPVYGNLNQGTFEECCYEQMKSQPQRPVNQLQHQGKTRKPRRKKDTSLEEDEEDRSCNPTTMASKVSIYLNSEQLAAENVEAIHDDPIR